MVFATEEPLEKETSYPELVRTHRDAEKKTHKQKCRHQLNSCQHMFSVFPKMHLTPHVLLVVDLLLCYQIVLSLIHI